MIPPQITSHSTVCLTICSGWQKRKDGNIYTTRILWEKTQMTIGFSLQRDS